MKRLSKKALLVLLFMFLSLPFQTIGLENYGRIAKYGKHFIKYSKKYFGPHFDWRYFKAQAIVESRLRPDARSENGAVGIMQLLPKTFNQVAERNPEIKDDICHPRWNIAAAIKYDKILC